MTTIGSQMCKLSHKCFRAMLKKFRRKKKRQCLAAARENQQLLEERKRESSPNYEEREAEKRRNTELWEEYQERERIRKHKAWLLREAQAQAAFRKKKDLQEQESIKREEQRKKMLAELEEKNVLENEAKEQCRKEKLKKEETLQEALSGLPQGNEPWHNPIAPENYHVGIQQDREQCQFFSKTGCCRFGDRCSRGHKYPTMSTTLLIKGMYSHFSISQSSRDDYDTDMALEFEDSETYQDFKSFYDDVLPEFKKFGNVIQFKVCCNHELHLRGNVYVQYSREEYAVEAYKAFNGRYYAGKQLTCAFTSVVKWRSAICGLYESKRCPKGNNCNFLHVFKNPRSEFWSADRDFSSQRRSERSLNSHRPSSYRSQNNNYSPRYPRSNDSHQKRRRESSIDSHYSHKSHHSSTRSKRHHYSSESDMSDEGDYSRTSTHRTSDQRHTSDSQLKEHKKISKLRSRSKSESSSSLSSPSVEEEKKHSKKRKKKKKKSKKHKKRRSKSPE